MHPTFGLMAVSLHSCVLAAGLGSPPTYGLSAGHFFQGDPWPFSMPNSAAPSRATSPKTFPSSLSGFTLPNMSSI